MAETATGAWRNWAGTATATPARLVRPTDPGEIADAVTDAERDGLPVRAIGAGHSFTSVAATDGVAIDLSRWTGIAAADAATGLVTVRAGTTLHDLNASLDQLGLAMTNLGDIDAQTIAGAVSTGTHGTGARYGGIATQIAALELVLADGSLVSCSPTERPELFEAARIGLGALGVLSTVTLRCEPAFVLAADERPEPIDGLLERFDHLADTHDHVEFHWFPYGRKALLKRNDRQPAGTQAAPLSPLRHYLEYELLENVTLAGMSRLGRAVPRLVRPLHRTVDAVLSARTYSDSSHRVFVSTRNVRFVESEYALPRDTLVDVLGELRGQIPKLADPVMFPLEVRVAAADDVWLSTAYGRDSAYIAVHQYLGMPYRQFFDLFESITANVGGRPHWGKLHSLGAEQLAELYPRFGDFRDVREAVDPAGRFTNPYTARVIGPCGERHDER
ncbi:MAG TPA: D-arabinono-1,4-lactone oxidase [Pseudonocardiaceae bacterium]|nr:D-arabinono-1,4-lactone oxidase [Pseudonocardiaceae bacterium]